MMARQAQEDRAALRRNYQSGYKALVMVALPVAVLTSFTAPALIGILGGQAFLPEGAIALQIMIWSIPIGWINSLTQYVLIALDRQRQITGIFVLAVSFNVLGNLLFLPRYSYQAAAVTTILSEMVLLAGFLWLLRHELGRVTLLRTLWRPVVATLVMLACLAVVWPWQPLLALLVASAVYVLGLGLLRPLTAEEGQRLARIVPTPLLRWVVQ
ncbi:MAG: hypothetical protein HC915_16820 [Anaerolineae bacterium]|nr:hypothetical protein [Anaerolineae bacterium]